MSRTKRNTDRGGGKEWNKEKEEEGKKEREREEEEFLAGSSRTTCSGSSTQVYK